jgi:hypothetical protein
MRVPETTVLSRKLAPFKFGEATSSDVKWIRTAPSVPVPGHFSTIRGWTDPFKLLTSEDPTGELIASVLIQSEIAAQFSGALLTSMTGDPIIEGVAGIGDTFMLGQARPHELPPDVEGRVQDMYDHLWHDLGSIRVEWVDDGQAAWIIQLQQEPATSLGTIIVPGTTSREVEFGADNGLGKLRNLLETIEPDTGVVVIGNIGMTSHMADILRRAKIPSRLVRIPPTSDSAFDILNAS